MTEKLEQLFDLPEIDHKHATKEVLAQATEISNQIKTTDEDKTDREIDDLTARAVDSYENLMNLGMNTEARFSAPIFDVASKMLGHAITAKLGKAQKKLKEAEIKLKAAKMAETQTMDGATEITAVAYDRNELIKSLRKQ
jgi:hypothetical protein